MKYWIPAFVLLAVSFFTCSHLLMAVVKCKAGRGFPSDGGQGRQVRLVDHKDHTHSLSTAPVMVKAVLSQRERRADTARYVRTARESATPQ